MSSEALSLSLTPRVRATLATLLAAAAVLRDGARVVDHVPINSWGELDEFRRQVYDPLHAKSAQWTAGIADAVEVTLEPDDVQLIRDVLDGLAESISGGNPWVSVTGPERAAVDRLIAQLANDA